VTDFAPWIHGSASGDAADPPVQVQRADDDTFVLRQSKSAHFEAPFVYLLLGDDRALLVDTGATEDSALRDAVDAILAERERSRPGYALIVGHSHAHGDHRAGDGSFAGRPHTTVVGTDLAALCAFFGLGDDLSTVVELDLGGRVLEVVRIPGHHATSIAVFDERTGWLLTGDTVYKGRLYIDDAPAFVATMARLERFAAQRAVTAVLGCHIEMTTTPGVDYPRGTLWQPDEPPLALTPEQFAAVCGAAGDALLPGRHVYDDFVIES
jgi:glyoxylase-like metal-dependent hydrolase (beta-lactamase superfamily II)